MMMMGQEVHVQIVMLNVPSGQKQDKLPVFTYIYWYLLVLYSR